MLLSRAVAPGRVGRTSECESLSASTNAEPMVTVFAIPVQDLMLRRP